MADAFTGYTERISADLQTTKQNIVKARAGLQQRGLISFTAGTRKENPPLYTIIDRTSQLSVPLSENLSVKMSVPLSPNNIKIEIIIFIMSATENWNWMNLK